MFWAFCFLPKARISNNPFKPSSTHSLYQIICFLPKQFVSTLAFCFILNRSQKSVSHTWKLHKNRKICYSHAWLWVDQFFNSEKAKERQAVGRKLQGIHGEEIHNFAVEVKRAAGRVRETWQIQKHTDGDVVCPWVKRNCENWKAWHDWTRMGINCLVVRPACSRARECAVQVSCTRMSWLAYVLLSRMKWVLGVQKVFILLFCYYVTEV